ncbi:hypothetical protein ACGFIF_11665 [Kribbella sp. NPDC049174]|uniref:hypothetical protein n=1 Tax=Kribbella sp. NPDC049174 TaxID=3364112 RepID=UPI0037129455
MRRWVGTGLAAISCLAAVVGCGVPTGGVVGVTVDAAGRPVVVVQMCEGHIDGATMYLPDDEEFGRWEVSPPVTDFSQFSLTDGGNGWRLVGSLKPREPETRYVIYGWSNDSSWSATHLEFSERDLEDLQAGTVLVPSADPDSTSNVTRSLPDFRSKTCEDWF